MPLGNLFSGADQQYVALTDDTGTWRILNTWHEDLKRLDAEDDIPDDSTAVTLLSEGQFIALMKEAASQGILSNVSFASGDADSDQLQSILDSKEEENMDLKDSITNLRSELAQSKSALNAKSPHSEEYDLKERAMESILKLVAAQDMANLSRD